MQIYKADKQTGNDSEQIFSVMQEYEIRACAQNCLYIVVIQTELEQCGLDWEHGD